MKRINALILCVIMIFSLNACVLNDGEDSGENANDFMTQKETDEYTQTVMDYIVERDTEEFPLLFSKHIQTICDLEAQIKGLEEYFDGEIVEYNNLVSNYSGSSNDENGYSRYTWDGTIYNVKTEGGKEYLITFKYYEIHPNGEDFEGLSCIWFKCLSDKDEDGHMPESAFYTIGYNII